MYQNLPVTIIGMGAGLVYSTLWKHTPHHGRYRNCFSNTKYDCNLSIDPEEMKLATTWCALKK